MKRNTLLLLTFVLIQSLLAQDNPAKEKRAWFDFQLAQHIGLNQWSSASYVNDGFISTTLSEIRIQYNRYTAIPNVGVFADFGLGVMPAPTMKSLDINRMPMPHSGTQYYLRETLSAPDAGNASAHVKMTFGLFGKIPAFENLDILPYFGIGMLTMPQRKFEIVLKEQGSNMQYKTTYIWNYAEDYEYDDPVPLTCLTGRLIFRYALSRKANLLLGLEYSRSLNTIDFYGKYSNTFNANIERDFNVKGNKMNFLGISVGISFL
jgi:hypothetical protein